MGNAVVLVTRLYPVCNNKQQPVNWDKLRLTFRYLGYISVVGGALLFNQGSKYTATLILHSLHLHWKFSRST